MLPLDAEAEDLGHALGDVDVEADDLVGVGVEVALRRVVGVVGHHDFALGDDLQGQTRWALGRGWPWRAPSPSPRSLPALMPPGWWWRRPWCRPLRTRRVRPRAR